MGYIVSHHHILHIYIYIYIISYIHIYKLVIHLSIHISRTHVLTINYLSLSVDSSFHPSSFPRYPYHITSHHIIDSSIFHSHPHSHPYIRRYVYIFTFLFIRAFYLPCICTYLYLYRVSFLLSTLYSLLFPESSLSFNKTQDSRFEIQDSKPRYVVDYIL